MVRFSFTKVMVLGGIALGLGTATAQEEWTYVKKDTRNATRQANLATQANPSERYRAWLDYHLDEDFPRSPEDRYYRVISLPLPEGVQFEPGGLEWLPGDRLVVSTRIGDVYLVDGTLDVPPHDVRYTLYASGLHEVLGLARRGEWLYAMQRGEVTRMKDEDGDDRADVFESVCDDWEINGDYHEYAFCSKFDREGKLWITLCLTGSFSSQVLYRGWAVTVDENGVMTPVCSGIRSPGGLGFNAEGDCFYTDNQGPWNGACILRHLKPGMFMGHPGGNRWYADAPNMGPRPRDPKDGSRWAVELAKIPELQNPAIFFPYDKMGQSASGVWCDTSGGKFGPFEHQLFVGDQTHSTVMRVFLEKVNGRYQGACFPFKSGFGSGIVPIVQASDGSLFCGSTARGWAARGGKPFALDRLVWTGETPFEIHEMRVQPDGFELTFTEPIDEASAKDLASYTMETYTYIYQEKYGSPEVDHTKPTIREARIGADGRSVRLVVDGLQIGHVHELTAKGVRSSAGASLLHDKAYYTLFYLP